MIRLDDSKRFRDLIRDVEKNLRGVDRSVFSCGGLTLIQTYALIEIANGTSLPLTVLATRLELQRSTTERAVSELVDRGLAVFQAQPEHAEEMAITLTSEGQELFDKIETSMNFYYANIFTHVPREKRPQVFESMQLILDAVSKSVCCGGLENCPTTQKSAKSKPEKTKK